MLFSLFSLGWAQGIFVAKGDRICVWDEATAALAMRYASFSSEVIELREITPGERTVLFEFMPSWFSKACSLESPGKVPKNVLYDLLVPKQWFVRIFPTKIPAVILGSDQLLQLHEVFQWPVQYQGKPLKSFRIHYKEIQDDDTAKLLESTGAVSQVSTVEFYDKIFS